MNPEGSFNNWDGGDSSNTIIRIKRVRSASMKSKVPAEKGRGAACWKPYVAESELYRLQIRIIKVLKYKT